MALIDGYKETGQTVLIANGATTSATVNAAGYLSYSLAMPAAFTGTSVTFLVSADNITFNPLYTAGNAAVSLTVAPSRNYVLPAELSPWPYFQIVSGTAEGGSRSLAVLLSTAYAADLANSGGSVVQRVNAGFMAVGQTAKQASGNLSVNAVSATVTINTVTTGKSFYITDICFSTDSATAIDVQIKAASTIIFETHVLNTSPCNAIGIETQPFATTAQAVTLFVSNSSAGKTLNYFVSGFEQ